MRGSWLTTKGSNTLELVARDTLECDTGGTLESGRGDILERGGRDTLERGGRDALEPGAGGTLERGAGDTLDRGAGDSDLRRNEHRFVDSLRHASPNIDADYSGEPLRFRLVDDIVGIGSLPGQAAHVLYDLELHLGSAEEPPNFAATE